MTLVRMVQYGRWPCDVLMSPAGDVVMLPAGAADDVNRLMMLLNGPCEGASRVCGNEKGYI